jgi:hypothetical protein
MVGGYRSESLAGDLIEQYLQGRSRAWFWKQVLQAIIAARVRRVRLSGWNAAQRVLGRVCMDAAAVLAVIAIVTELRRSHSLQDVLSSTSLLMLSALLAVASLGLRLSLWPRTPWRRRAVASRVLALFAAVALGVGTLAWADTLRTQPRQVSPCGCVKCERPCAPAHEPPQRP